MRDAIGDLKVTLHRPSFTKWTSKPVSCISSSVVRKSLRLRWGLSVFSTSSARAPPVSRNSTISPNFTRSPSVV